jgi:DNA-binding response OmpR family regulator
MVTTKVLYVEDEPFLGRIVKESLESRNFTVHMVADGKDAVGEFSKVSPDICVLDVMLPNKDGFSIARDLRKINPVMPIIFVTAKIQTEDLVKGFESGGNDYIRKPFSMEELIVRIQNLLKITTKTVATQDGFVFGTLEFIPQRYELKAPSGIKKLSYREATLLQMLVENKNATTLRKDILMKLWGDDSFFNSRNLDVYITKLRDYIKEDPLIEIKTIKGIGYHFSCGQ